MENANALEGIDKERERDRERERVQEFMKVVSYPLEVPSCVFNLCVVTLNMLFDAVKIPYSKMIFFFFLCTLWCSLKLIICSLLQLYFL